ncbi:abortive infection family protein [Brevibacillus humidisoli]|uniref:abortive infection family protein n=1 Tax=Brevibacillus humidisoli TaxID=2895522 RepID=UPI001E45D0EC|nr:abortive infection family protein [Brevibacillus humidisoli]UFJ41242.1 abortive infection family protein [Brevibacillus humidisoli]
MKVSERTIQAIGQIVTGDNGISFYRSGPELVRFFNELGFDDTYGKGFPSRWYYAEQNIRSINGTVSLVQLLELQLDPRQYIGREDMLEAIVTHLNNYLKFDGYELVKVIDFYKVKEIKGSIVELEVRSQELVEINQLFIVEQIQKCDHKILTGDYDGAITNARSLVEAVLIEIEKKRDSKAPEYDGDLIKLYKRVQKLLNLEPSRKDISEPLKQVLSGLNSIVTGLSGIRNKMSDSHVITYKPSKHHAKLAVNSAKTFADFIFETFEFQREKGLIEVSSS